MLSYLILAALALVVGYFIISEIRVYVSTDISYKNDTKLLKTGTILTQLHEAESLSKIALQNKSSKDFSNYTQKIDSIFVALDSLKKFTSNDDQKSMLDSVQLLLQKKVINSNELRLLKAKIEANSSIDDALKGFNMMEESLGKISPESLAPDYYDLPVEAQTTLKKWADYLSENVPKDSTTPIGVDSVLTASKTLLTEAKKSSMKTLRSLAEKEWALNRTDLELSQQLRNIIAAFEQEIILKTYTDNINKQTALTRSIRLAGIAAILGFIVVALFTFLITKDYWKVQRYRQQLEKEKKFSESLLKSREQLISMVSHDLRTPLTTITGYSELLEGTPITEKQFSYVHQIKSASHYVDSLVNDLLDFSKLEAGKIKVENRPFVLSELIRNTGENIAEIYSEKNIPLIFEIDERLDRAVMGDAFRVRQVLSNLISNAYKFTHIGSIRIQAEVAKETPTHYHTVIAISDSGIGIKKERQEQIFKEFTQADDHTDKKYGGYGLGLTISKKLTALLNGKISVNSEEDKGSTFTINIPFEISNIPIPPRDEIALTPKKALSLLIIDDDIAMLKLLKEVCHSLGITAHTYNTFNAIKKESPLSYHMVLTDIQMPDLSGFQVLDRLQNSGYMHYKQQPIVAMTGRKDLEKKVYSEAGFADILQKPFTKTSLLKVLQGQFPEAIHDKEVPKTETIPVSGSHLFSLEIINSFLGNNKLAVAEVLQTFKADTLTNMERLSMAIAQMNTQEINAISHRMLPMFRQLKSADIVPILEELELLAENDMTEKAIKLSFADLKNKVTVLLLAIKSYLAKDPNYRD